ncbi:hypothetical protein [Mycolicibacterium canariasense]|uniref:hypothetical protein n=1 Tax=Mycolicibacterium canariasense TaxID=228230 RepID=UPI0007881076|nr:hypothetical protein [Mycolicibacterium canariasense]MCV7207772.1 hypothetical protein [Mycolicibacterium canariasense]ORV04834.1 hypothetical protein AWB94_21040 [Mycolicibacterium canariasense]
MRPANKRTVRIVFGATVLWIVVLQYIPFAVWRAEPYPALVLPGFPAQCAGCLLETGVPRTKEPAVVARFTDGAPRRVPLDSLLPAGPSVRLMVFTAAFSDGSVATDPDAVAWLRSRTAQLFPGYQPTGLDIVWRTATYRAADASAVEYQPLRTIHIDFGNPT